MKNLGKMDLIKGIEIFLELNKKKVVTYEEAEIMFNILNSADLKAVQNYGAYTEKEQWLFEIFSKKFLTIPYSSNSTIPQLLGLSVKKVIIVIGC